MNSIAIPAKQRIQSIDILRGIVMVIMALDHTRDFFHKDGMTGDPLNLATTTPLLYFTRWITHLCAPTFVFLSGTSAWLQSRRKSKKELSKFLITRGLWLILIEITVMSMGILGDIHLSIIGLQTFWSIGISMVLLGLIIWLPFPVILSIGMLIVLGHNGLDFEEASSKGDVPFLWRFAHMPGFYPLGANHSLLVLYPFLPWTGLMIVGYCFGKIFTEYDTQKRDKILRYSGIGLLIFFAIARLIDIYGDPLHWSKQKDTVHTIFSFMNVQKYPPSLLYMCATIGPGLIFMSFVNTASNKLSKFFLVYGRVPMFYYILHFYLLTILRIISYLSHGHSIEDGMKGGPNIPFKFVAPGEGFSLAVVYLIWIAVVIALYPLCKWYDKYKTDHPEKKWLSYL